MPNPFGHRFFVVGIGTTIPQSLLDVTGPADSAPFSMNCPTGWCHAQFESGGVTAEMRVSSSGNASFGTSTNDGLAIFTNNVTRIYFDNAGKVGLSDLNADLAR